MFYVVQQNLFNENGFRQLIRIMEQNDLPFTVVKMIPFSGLLEPEISPPMPCMVYGSIGLTKLAKDRGWTPGAFLNDNFDFSVWVQKWPGHVLNDSHKQTTFRRAGEAAREAFGLEEFFCRPCADDKSFTGEVMNQQEHAEWVSRITGIDSPTLSPDTPVIVSKPRHISKEYRFFVLDGKVITGSLYKLNGRSHQGLCVDQAVIDFAQARVDQWVPDRGFVIDIGETPKGLKVIEMGCMNGAGFYESDISKLLQAVEAMAF